MVLRETVSDANQHIALPHEEDGVSVIPMTYHPPTQIVAMAIHLASWHVTVFAMASHVDRAQSLEEYLL